MPRSLLLPLACALLVCSTGCRSTHAVERSVARRSGDTPSPGAAPDRESERSALRAVVRQLEGGAIEEAYDSLGRIVHARQLARARAAFARNAPEDGLLAVDEALSLAPRDPATLLLKAEGSLALAQKKIAEGGSAGLIEGALYDAREYFAKCPRGPEALLGESRTASLMGETTDALALAREADALLAERPEPLAPGELSVLPERVLAEAAFRAYTEAKQAGEAASELYATTEDALARLLGRKADDPWVWGTLADLQEWEERLDEARATLERGLERVPHDPMLLERLARVARKQGGPAEALAAFEAYTARFPEASLALWYESLQRFDDATEKLMARFDEEGERPSGATVVAGYERAEEDFRDTREREPDFADACLGYEVMCRAGRGWAHYQDGDLEAAEAAFRSMDEVVERGLEWKIEGRILSGVDGLHLVGTRYNDREDWLAAARVYAFLHDYQPDDAVWANNTGFFYRDAAVALEAAAKRACAAAHGHALEPAESEALGLSSDADAATLARRADELARRAHELMEKSRKGYEDAVALAPEDVRVVNDAALVLVYYLHEDLDQAERWLRRCIEMGERQLEDPALEDDARWELKNAWGDACQNLGVLLAIHRDRPDQAVEWFERSIAIGPEPRPMLSNFWVPLLQGKIEGDRDFELYSLLEWAAPCNL